MRARKTVTRDALSVVSMNQGYMVFQANRASKGLIETSASSDRWRLQVQSLEWFGVAYSAGRVYTPSSAQLTYSDLLFAVAVMATSGYDSAEGAETISEYRTSAYRRAEATSGYDSAQGAETISEHRRAEALEGEFVVQDDGDEPCVQGRTENSLTGRWR